MDFKYNVEQFADLRILRYRVPNFELLSLRNKKMIYYLSEAALCGRDILWDQNNKFNLKIRNILEKIYSTISDDYKVGEWDDFVLYFKRILFSNGIHHHYSMDKIIPSFSKDYFNTLISSIDLTCSEELMSVIFDSNKENKRVVLDSNVDVISSSANNFYEGLSQQEVEEYYLAKKNKDNRISNGLNSKLVKINGKIEERIWKLNGMYSSPIEKILENLNKALKYTETEQQNNIIQILIKFYETGDLSLFDKYSIEWIKDTTSLIDFVNGFIEVYGDSLGYKGSWESIVNILDKETSKRASLLSDNAQWFEDNSPISSEYKKEKVVGVSAKVVNVAILAGDCYPYTPIGINLPNAEWIRAEYGSKSISIENIIQAYHYSSLESGQLEEFAFSNEEISRSNKYGFIGNCLHTDLHECLGHGSGKLKEGVDQDALKNYASTLEEARADLFALYYIMDDKLIDLGIIPNLEVGKAEYDSYIRNGLIVQLTRIESGKNIEESHMRNRQLIAKWVYEKGENEEIISKKIKNNKTYYVVNDYCKLRSLFADLLKEIQRIKSEGDFEAGKALVENYGVIVDKDIHIEVLERYQKLNIAPYAGFLNPKYELVKENNEIVDVSLSYGESFIDQMMRYSKDYSFL
ncbi:dihydrofolate reductase [Marinilabiliaceae bacterium JC040]|nr:dihydrofolate reductase [Marinilabiliaceae bacterium JC040]